MEERELCLKDFPYECKNCKFYREYIKEEIPYFWPKLIFLSLFNPRVYLHLSYGTIKVQQCEKYKKEFVSPLK